MPGISRRATKRWSSRAAYSLRAMAEPVTDLVLESPAGLIRLHCECRDGTVTSVSDLATLLGSQLHVTH